ncbi:MAG: hypothetical protein AB1896_18675 [Thermodesulfobacteriota bacterium]
MESARMIYEFGAHAGALEGYVYGWAGVDANYLPRWTENLVKEYQALPGELRSELQPGLDGTLGRALRTLLRYLEECSEAVRNLMLVVKELPSSPDDFAQRGRVPPGSLRELYEFAANAGAFEGYAYIRARVDYKKLSPWAGNLARQFGRLPETYRAAIEEPCRLTLGRAVQSLRAFLGDDDPVIVTLMSMIKGELPPSPDDFVRH